MENKMFDTAVQRATAKRDRIIAREGDLGGERLQPWYLEQLIQEEIDMELSCLSINPQMVNAYA